MIEFNHISVLRDESIELMNIKQDGIYVDGTTGGGGHSYEIAKRLTNGRLICFDQDEDAIAAAKKRLAEFTDRITFVNRNFIYIEEELKSLGISGIDGAIMDLGVSSFQLDEAKRGFSYMHDAPLDMRMDRRKNFSAYDVVNTYSKEKLSEIFFRYGEEKWSKRIAEFIVEERSKAPIKTTYELVSIIKKAVPKAARADGPHPAKRTFQAIRIEVNEEFSVLEEAVRAFVHCMNNKGRLAVITFHSLEDRIVKTAFSELSRGCTCPKDFPICVCNKKPIGKCVNKKPISASDDELYNNPRARSAKLRVFERIIKE